MASYGFEIINSFGSILIDDKYPNLALRQKGGVKLGSNNRLNVPMTNGFSSPLVASASTRPVRSDMINTTAITPYIHIRGREGDPPADVDYYMFDKPLFQPTNGEALIQLFNAAGQVTFDSRLKYARVIDVFGGATQAEWATTKTYAAGRKYAVVQLRTAWRRSTVRAGGGRYTLSYRSAMARVVGNQVITSFQVDTVKENFNRPLELSDMGATFAVIDVTGY